MNIFTSFDYSVNSARTVHNFKLSNFIIKLLYLELEFFFLRQKQFVNKINNPRNEVKIILLEREMLINANKKTIIIFFY